VARTEFLDEDLADARAPVPQMPQSPPSDEVWSHGTAEPVLFFLTRGKSHGSLSRRLRPSRGAFAR